MARPEILFPLFAECTTLAGVGPKAAQALARLNLTRLRDLLYHLPHGVVDRRLRNDLVGCDPGEVVTLRVQVGQHRPGRTASQPYRVVAEGPAVQLELVFFRARSDWLEKLLPPGVLRVISGKVEMFEGRWQMTHPDYVMTEVEAADLPVFEPVYALTQGLGQKQIGKALRNALEQAPEMEEWIHPSLLASPARPAE
ncbi:MAG: ATP-dependent DNA helicase RecG, partial [Pseudomonadota bacterium]